MPFWSFIKEKLPNLNIKSQKEYLNSLDIVWNIVPLVYFILTKSYLDYKTMKSFVAKLKEYDQEFIEFILEILKSLFIEKDLKQHETKDTLVKNGNK